MLVELVETPPGVGRVVVAATPGTPGLDIPPVGSRGVRSPVSLFTKKKSLVQGWAVDSWSVCTSNMFTTVTCVIFHWFVLL